MEWLLILHLLSGHNGGPMSEAFEVVAERHGVPRDLCCPIR